MYLLDTNVCVEYLRGRNPPIVARFSATPQVDISLCSVVIAELYHGAYRSQHAAINLTKVEAFVRPFASFPFDDEAAREYGRVRADLERRGTIIGPHDLQIAAIALVHGLTLVTHNIREFRQVNGLTLEDWHASP